MICQIIFLLMYCVAYVLKLRGLKDAYLYESAAKLARDRDKNGTQCKWLATKLGVKC